MASACVLEELPASAETVWAMIEDFGDISAWGEGAKVVKIEGAGAGARREVETPVGMFKERCEAHDPARLTFSYAIIEAPVPFSSYLAVVTLIPIDDLRCKIEWKCTFEPRGVTEADGIRLVEATCRDSFIVTLRETITTRH